MLTPTCIYYDGLKKLYDDIWPAVDDIFDQWDPTTATLGKKCVGCKGDYIEK